MARNTLHPPLQERVPQNNNTLHRLVECVILFLLFCLLLCRLVLLPHGGTVWLVASLCESWFTFVWFLFMNAKWTPAVYKTYPDRLTKRFDDLPAVDMFVTTADPKLEPPIVTVNTVLSMLAVDYPAEKLACYVSDDGCSPITFYSLVEASKFAKLWVPFCKKYNVEVRAPFVYFSSEPRYSSASASDFAIDWAKMKNEYEELSSRIENAEKSYIPHHMNDEFAEFLNTGRKNHPTIIKVIWENKGDLGESIPHLIYVSREKRPKHPHHFKAGAMNVLTRVSGVMTNAPFMLNVDCDMFVNNPKVILHGMCLLLGFEKDVHSAFVQTPQQFYGALKDDPFGNQLVVLQKKVGVGMTGIQGPFYGGTGCFHRRKIIYSSSQDAGEKNKHTRNGTSKVVVFDISSRIDAAKNVASCTYELNTSWGEEIGWVYGSMTEDIQTGLRIHSMGLKSKYMVLDPPAFLGSAPVGGPSSLTQYKRWATGLLEVLLGRQGPLVALFKKRLTVRQCLAYLLINVWALRSLFELCYALIPAYCLLANASFVPKVSDRFFFLPSSIFILYNAYTLAEYLECGLSFRAWWNNQRMLRITSTTAWLFGLLSVILKTLGLSENVFEVTRKDRQDDAAAETDPSRFTFDESPMFVPGAALVLIHLSALAVGLGRRTAGLGELLGSLWVVLSFWPFGGFSRKGELRDPVDCVVESYYTRLLVPALCFT
ncbi:cellulose synthase-like protein H1 isoform X2 [Ananas comosus]|uniref:Cellulose synthase-like protein H1 isoform X2 n=1 Tax=Ananas comosus TaxID=4615 RepID=A0A6P5GFP1_ANACO|nr:cellulose synthase-like protein H1 isoform X2 [Ananas comosus]